MIPQQRPAYFAAPGFVASYKLPGKDFQAKAIVNAVATFYEVDAKKLLWKTRTREIVTPRHVAMYFVRKYTSLTLDQIGRLFKRDHTVAIYALRSVKDLCDTDPIYRQKIQHLTNILLEM